MIFPKPSFGCLVTASPSPRFAVSPRRRFAVSPFPRLAVSLLALLLLPTLALTGHAQQITPHLGYVYPAGGRQGTSFQVVLGGQFLPSATNAFISGSGVQARVIEYTRPLTQKEFNELRDKLRELQEKRVAAAKNGRRRGAQAASNTSTNQSEAALPPRPIGWGEGRGEGNSPAGIGFKNTIWTAADERMVEEIRKKLATFLPRTQINPAIAETAILQVTMAAEAEPGQRELRLETPQGLSNPLRFYVGCLPEFTKRAATANHDLQNLKAKFRRGAEGAVPATEMNITLPAVVNGQTMPGGVDRYHFKAHAGQRLVVAVSARELIPYLPDAVPGWFQASISLYDRKGQELQYADHFRFNPDPVLSYEIPQEGEYTIEIRDSIYRGREDFVYRITMGELPFVTSLFPLGAPAGAQTAVELKGWNLPATQLTIQEKEPGIHPLPVPPSPPLSVSPPPPLSVSPSLPLAVSPSRRLSASPSLPLPWPFAVDTLPESLEQEPNDHPTNAQPVTLPLIVNGRIEKPGDRDVFRFEGRAGSEFVAEVYARRLNSPLDSVLRLTDAAGRQLAYNDDYEDKGSGLNTHHADSFLKVTLPTNGTYYLHLADAQHQGGPEYAYRLRLSPPQPDFELRVTPSSLTLRGGVSAPLTVYALRKDGFTNEIVLALDQAPSGFSLSGGRIPANQDQVRVTLSASSPASKEPVPVSLEGRAFIQGRPVVHPAVPAEDMMQAFAYRHLVPAQELKVAVVGRWAARSFVRLLGEGPVKIPAGGTVRVPITGPLGFMENRVQLELSEPPEGIAIEKVATSRDGAELVLHSDASKVKPGLKGNLIVNAFASRAAGAGKAKAQNNRQRPLLGTLPAIPFEVVPQ